MKNYQKPIMTIHNLTSEERIGACKMTSDNATGAFNPSGEYCTTCVNQQISGVIVP